MRSYMESYYQNIQDYLLEFDNKNSKKKFANHSTKFLEYQLEAGYDPNVEEAVQRNVHEGNI